MYRINLGLPDATKEILLKIKAATNKSLVKQVETLITDDIKQYLKIIKKEDHIVVKYKEHVLEYHQIKDGNANKINTEMELKYKL